MRRALLALALLVPLAAGRCASGKREPPVRVTTDKAFVRPCIDLARITTDADDKAGEADLRQQTAELGGNVLLVYNSHSGGAFYCETLPPGDITVSRPGLPRTPTPRQP